MSEKFQKRLSIASASFLLVLLLLGFGVAVGKYQIWPYSIIDEVYTVTKSLIKYGEVIPVNRLIRAPDYVSREHLTVHNKSAQSDGYYAYTGWDDVNKSYAMWLYDSNGEQINHLTYDYYDLDANGPLNNSDSPHAFHVLSDGSFMVSFDEGDVMARIDACGKAMWTQEGVYHHSLQRAEDGTFWTWRGENSAYGHYNYLVNFDADTGNVIKEIGLVEDLIKTMGDDRAGIYGVRSSYDFIHVDFTPENKDEVDIFHPNDIDVLYSDIADKFPNFNAGDLVISLRNTHLIAVVDPNTFETKWSSNGPWRFQHDPDFTSDGMISIYNNNTDLTRSEIIKINPSTNYVVNELHEGNLFFYSAAMGKHQYLPNDNLLITNPGEGRIVEVDKKGDLVFEINNLSQISIDYNVHIANAQWLPRDYFDQKPSCNN